MRIYGMEKNKLNTADGQPLPKLAYTRKEAARLISQSVATLDRLVERGLIHPSRATSRPLFSHLELERYLRDTTSAIN